MSGSTELWIVIRVTVFLTIIISVVTLWVRWKLSGPRRDRKRSISVQLEKIEVKKASKATSGSSLTPDTDSKPSSSKISGSKKKSQMPHGGKNAPGRLVGRDRSSPAQQSGTESLIMIISGPLTHCYAGEIHIINSINIDGRRPHHHAHQDQRIEESHPRSPRIALDSLPLNHPAQPPENQPWMHQDRSGRWVPREEGYLHPGLPPPPYLWTGGPDTRPVIHVQDARRERMYVPAWRVALLVFDMMGILWMQLWEVHELMRETEYSQVQNCDTFAIKTTDT